MRSEISTNDVDASPGVHDLTELAAARDRLSLREQARQPAVDRTGTLLEYRAGHPDNGVARPEPMREAVTKLHQGLSRVADELVRMSGYSAVQIATLAAKLESVTGKVDEVREDTSNLSGTLERRLNPMQQRVENLDVRLDSTSSTLSDEIARLATTLDGVRAEASKGSVGINQHLALLKQEIDNLAARQNGTSQGLTGKLETLTGGLDDVRAAASGASNALERHLAVVQEGLDGVDVRQSVAPETPTGEFETGPDEVRTETSQTSNQIEQRLALAQQSVETLDARQRDASATLSGKLETLTQTLEQLRAASAATSGALDRRLEHLAERSEIQISGLSGELESLKDELNDIRSHTSSAISELGRHLTHMAGQSAQQNSSLAGNLESLAQRLDDDWTKTLNRSTAIDRRVAELQQGLEGLHDRQIEKSHTIDEKLEALAEGLNEIRAATSDASSALERGLTLVQQGMQSLDDRQWAVTRALADANERESAAASLISRLEQNLMELQATASDRTTDMRLAGIERNLADLAAQTPATDPDMASLPARIGRIDEKLGALSGGIESAERTYFEALAELRRSLREETREALDERLHDIEEKQRASVDALKNSLDEIRHSSADAFHSAPPLPGTEVPAQDDDAIGPAVASAAPPMLQAGDDVNAIEPPPFPASQDFAAATSDDFAGDEVEYDFERDSREPIEDALPPFLQFEMADAGPPGMSPEFSLAAPGLENTLVRSDEESSSPTAFISAARRSAQAAADTADIHHGANGLFRLWSPGSTGESVEKKNETKSYTPIAAIVLVCALAAAIGFWKIRTDGTPAASPGIRPAAGYGETKSHSAPRVQHPKSASAVTTGKGTVAGADQLAALATAGNARAQTIMGLRYLEHAGDSATQAQAAIWLERAAAQGNALAQYHLAEMYARGQGLPTDLGKAFHLDESAAASGNMKAMDNLAVAYARGIGTTKDIPKAVHWFAKAAQMGLVDAQFDLAVLYERGIGVPQSLVNAYRWYAIAARQGDGESKTRVDALRTQLSAADRFAAEKSADAFVASPMDAQVNDAP